MADTASLDHLRDQLTQSLGSDAASTLMAVVTSLDTTNLATKDDLRVLRADMATMKRDLIAAFRGELITAITAQTKPLLIAIVSTAVVFAGALLTAVRLG